MSRTFEKPESGSEKSFRSISKRVSLSERSDHDIPMAPHTRKLAASIDKFPGDGGGVVAMHNGAEALTILEESDCALSLWRCAATEYRNICSATKAASGGFVSVNEKTGGLEKPTI